MWLVPSALIAMPPFAIAVDTFVLLFQLNRRAKEAFPDSADRKGITLYAVLRTLQLRRLRLPPPRVRRGGAPVLPKTKG